LNPAQCRAARGLLNMTQQHLAFASGVSLRIVASFEAGDRNVPKEHLAALAAVLEGAGAELVPEGPYKAIGGPGVRLKAATR
jgi:transcriptional regulator with XRE-family HTH domain